MIKRKGSIFHKVAALVLATAVVVTGAAFSSQGMLQVQAAEAKTVYRISGNSRYTTSLAVAEQTRKEMGIDQFDAVILATGAGFADALSGSYLSYVKQAPILLIDDSCANDVRSYVRRYLKENGTVYVLGGETAVPGYLVKFQHKENGQTVQEFQVKRLSGADRYETNLKILAEAGGSGEGVLIATGAGYADSLSAAAAKKPIMLVGDALTSAQKNYLNGVRGNCYVLGGTAAVSKDVYTQAASAVKGNLRRISGSTRYETSEQIAKTFCLDADTVVLAYGKNFPDGLSGALLAVTKDAPILLSEDDRVAETRTFIAQNTRDADGYVLGGTSCFQNPSIASMFSVDPATIQKVTYTSSGK